ncbi:LacI family DNA-binding transcriptional regulator [Amnibacterium sp.]|uniref:LacI family DNA-binding transcriptional regulator n=1 Tax=Amnibacterium sp. TaxID=1872496 RepID=UPI003F7BAD84
MSRARRIADVAAAAGVSPTTVSHALSGKRAVSEATRERIMQAIADLDYRPNLVASGLRKQRTHSIALLVADIANPYYPAVARAVHDGVSEAGYVTLIGNTDGEPDAERDLLREMLARGVDGVVMQPLSTAPREIREIVGPSFPMVLLSGLDAEPVADVVGSDDAHGIAEAVKHLAQSGVREVGFISGPDGRAPGTTRLSAFRASARALDLEVREDWVLHTPFTRDGGFAAATALLRLDQRPRAVLCANDLIAIGVLDAARALELSVPGDVAVIGFDDIETADLVTPRLTTVVNPAAAAGAACARALLRRIEGGPDLPYARFALRTHLVRRASA